MTRRLAIAVVVGVGLTQALEPIRDRTKQKSQYPSSDRDHHPGPVWQREWHCASSSRIARNGHNGQAETQHRAQGEPVQQYEKIGPGHGALLD